MPSRNAVNVAAWHNPHSSNVFVAGVVRLKVSR